MSDASPDQLDEMFRLIASLPERDIGPRHAERLLTRCHALLDRHQTRISGWRIDLTRFYGRVLEPALLSSLALVYVLWAFERAGFLLGLLVL